MLLILALVYLAAGSWQAAKEFALHDKIYRDVVTQLLNKRRFDEVQYDLQESGAEADNRVRYWSIDIRKVAVQLEPGASVLLPERPRTPLRPHGGRGVQGGE